MSTFPSADKRIALLIDADNSPAAKIDLILAELAKLGVANIRRAYGNWKKNELKGWEKVLHECAIRPIQQFDVTKGKNATDMLIAIDAMDLLYTDRPDAFGIVSSDADFTPLVMHLRAKGATVYGFGAKKTPAPFVNACSRFLYLESLGSRDDEIEALPGAAAPASAPSSAPAPAAARGAAKRRTGRAAAQAEPAPAAAPEAAEAPPKGRRGRAKAAPAAPAVDDALAAAADAVFADLTAGDPEDEPVVRTLAGPADGRRPGAAELRRDARLVNLLRRAVEGASGDDGWSNLGAVRTQVDNQAPFDPRNHGFRKFSDLIEAIGLFELERRGQTLYVRGKRAGRAGGRGD